MSFQIGLCWHETGDLAALIGLLEDVTLNSRGLE